MRAFTDDSFIVRYELEWLEWENKYCTEELALARMEGDKTKVAVCEKQLFEVAEREEEARVMLEVAASDRSAQLDAVIYHLEHKLLLAQEQGAKEYFQRRLRIRRDDRRDLLKAYLPLPLLISLN